MEAAPRSATPFYVFRAKRAGRIKIVWRDGSGACLYAKRLEKSSEKLGTSESTEDEDAQQSFVFEEIKTGIAALRAQAGKVPGSRW